MIRFSRRRTAADFLLSWTILLLCLPFPLLAATPPVEETFAALGIRVTSGAAPGYVNDAACGLCHKEYFTYQDVAMAKSFYRPSPQKVIEDFANNHYYHAPSRRHYEMQLRDGEYWFRRYQLDPEGKPINEFERKVDWIVGSGNHVRTYLFQTDFGELYELPLAWYTQDRKWGMQPGFEAADHLGVMRQVRRECMFCHNAYPDVPVGNDLSYLPHVFPDQLPEGTGCQRCHGPGEAHLRSLFGGEQDRERIRASIVNPGRLPPQRRDDVCYECHLLPAVAVTPLRRFGRPIYSFRPGDDLAEYLVAFDIREEGKAPEDRFEINHHPYRLQQSRCYRESQGRLSCLSCHDPHVKIAPPQRAAHYREKCLGCHQSLSHPVLADPEQDLDDCARCHMPERRTQDVIETRMTDHRIQIPPEGVDLTAPLRKQVPVITDIVFLDPERAPDGDLGDIYRILGVLKPYGQAPLPMLQRLSELLSRNPQSSAEPYYALAQALLRYRRYEEALTVLGEAEQRNGDEAHRRMLSAVTYIGLGNNDLALSALRRALQLRPAFPEAHYNLGLLLHAQGKLSQAENHLRQAVELRPNLAAGWYYLGRVQTKVGHHDEAVAAYRRALSVDPTFSRGYLAIAEAFDALGRPEEGLRYLRHGAEHAKSPADVRAALDQRQVDK